MIRDGRLWPWAIALTLAVTMLGNFRVMRLASADPSFAVEPDYYRKAVAWDSVMAQETRNATLGWTLAARLSPAADGRTAEVVADLRQRDGTPVTGAVVLLEATHNARANEILSTALAPATDGRYAARMAGGRRGLWELRFVATRGTDRFTATLRVDTTRDPLP